MNAINLTIEGPKVIPDSKGPDSPRHLSERLAQGILASGEVSPLIGGPIGKEVVSVKLVDTYESVPFIDRFKAHIEVLNEKFPGAGLAFTEEQIACFESLSKLPMYEIRPLAETVAVALYQDFKKLEQYIKQLNWPPNKIELVLGMLAQLQKSHAPYGWIEDYIEMDEENPNSTKSSKGLEENVIPVLQKMEKCVGSISKSIPQNSDSFGIVQAIMLKISIMRSMIKLGRNDSGTIFWLVLGESIEQVYEKLKPSLPKPQIDSKALSGVIDSSLIRKELEKKFRRNSDHEILQYLSDLIEWQIPAYEDRPSIIATLREIQKLCHAQPLSLEIVNQAVKKAIAKWHSELEDVCEKQDHFPLISKKDIFTPNGQRALATFMKLQRAECLMKKAKHLCTAMECASSFDLLNGGEEIREIKLISTLQNFLNLIEKLNANSEKELYSDFNQLINEVFLNGSPGFVKNAQRYFDNNGLSRYVDFCNKAQYYFSRQYFISKLTLIHRKYSLKVSRLDESQASQLKKDFSKLCLEFADLFLLLKLIDREKNKDYSDLNSDDFIKTLPQDFFDLILLKTDLEEEVATPSQAQDSDGLLQRTDSPVVLAQKKGEKVKRRSGVSAPAQVLEGPKKQEPELQGLEYRFKDLNMPSSGEIRREEALQLLRAYFGGIEVVEGGSHSKVKLKGGGFVAVPRHDTFATALIAQSVKKVLRQRETKKDS